MPKYSSGAQLPIIEAVHIIGATLSEDDVVDALKTMQWSRADRKAIPKGAMGVIGICERDEIILRFIFRKPVKYHDRDEIYRHALYDLYKIDGDGFRLHPALATACLTAASMYYDLNESEFLFSTRAPSLAADIVGLEHVGYKSAASIGIDNVKGSLRHIVNSMTIFDSCINSKRFPKNGVDFALSVTFMASMIWEQNIAEIILENSGRDQVVGMFSADPRNQNNYSYFKLSTVGYYINGKTNPVVNGKVLIVSEGAVAISYSEFLEAILFSADAETISMLNARKITVAAIKQYDSMKNNADVEYLMSVKAGIEEDTDSKRRYVPDCLMTVHVPICLPLLAKNGIKTLGIRATPKGLWMIPHIGNDRCQAFFYSERKSSVLTYGEKMAAVLNVICSAIWHDLVVAGEKVFVDSDGQYVSTARKHQDRSSDKKKHIRILPRELYIRSERVMWSSKDDHRKIMAAHDVVGHPRLLNGKKLGRAGKLSALEYGFIIPKGYTFVRPHTRGEDHGISEVRSTGLIALSTSLG